MKCECNDSHAKFIVCPSSIFFFACNPLLSYFNECQKSEIHFLLKYISNYDLTYQLSQRISCIHFLI